MNLPDEVLNRYKPERRMSVGTIVSIALIAFVVMGGINEFLPGAAFEEEIIMHRNWTVGVGWGCEVDMPHGLRRCESATLDGATVRMRGY